MRRILHIDMDAFFAAVEELRHPELRGKAVVVGGGGDPTKRGVVSTANYEARKYGIHSAMPLRTARRLCPDAVFLPVYYEEYARISAIIKGILRDFSPVIEDVGIDEAFLDISGIEDPPEATARKIKEEIRKRTGLSCSIGVAPNKLVAKMASDLQKPDGLTIVQEADIKIVLGPLAARKLWGVGPKTESRMKEMGINTIGELAELSLDELIRSFGPSYGQYLHDASRGIDQSPLVTEWVAKSTSREVTYEKDTGDWQQIARTLAALAAEVAADMKERGFKGRTVTVKIRFGDFKTYTRAKTIEEPTDSREPIRKAAFEAMGRFDLKKALPERKVRLVGLKVEFAFIKDIEG